MRPLGCSYVLLLPLRPALPAQADDDVTVRTETAALTVGGARLLSVEVPVGEVTIHAADGDRVEASLLVRCDEDSRRCRDNAAGIRLRQQRDGEELSLEVEGYPRHNSGVESPETDLSLRVPRGLAVALEVGVGDLEVRGLTADVDVELGVGEARVSLPASAVRDVSVDVGVGEAEVRLLP